MNKICLLLLTFLCFSCHKKLTHETTIALQPLEGFDTSLQDSIAHSLEKLYKVKVIQLPITPLPKKSITTFKGKRYNARILIKDLKENLPDSIDYVMGLTEKDICITKKDAFGNIKKPENKYRDFGIFGLGYKPGKSCVVSSKRLQTSNKVLFLERVKKVTAHELGHNLGLPHCTKSEACVMRSAAEKLSTVDNVSLDLCNSCWQKVK